MTSFQGYTGQLFVVCLLKGQLNYWELTGQVILHTFPGKDRCVYLDRPHPRLRVLDVDNFSRVGNMQELLQAITLPHQLPWRSNTAIHLFLCGYMQRSLNMFQIQKNGMCSEKIRIQNATRWACAMYFNLSICRIS